MLFRSQDYPEIFNHVPTEHEGYEEGVTVPDLKVYKRLFEKDPDEWEYEDDMLFVRAFPQEDEDVYLFRSDVLAEVLQERDRTLDWRVLYLEFITKIKVYWFLRNQERSKRPGSADRAGL